VVQREAGGDLLARQQPGGERAPRRRPERGARRLHRDQHQHDAQQPQVERGLQGQQPGRDGGAGAGEQHEPAPVDPVGEGAAEQPERDHRQALGEPDHAHPDRAVGEVPDLVQHRDQGDLAAERARRGAEPQPAEVRVRAQRPGVDDQVHDSSRYSRIRSRKGRRSSAAAMSSTTRVSG
jgi:hypothetical protein